MEANLIREALPEHGRMKRFSGYTDVDKALARLVSLADPKPVEEFIGVREAFGRVLTRNVLSPFDVPPISMSHVDGFAVRTRYLRDVSLARPLILKVPHRLGPGEKTSVRLRKGEAHRILTGGYLPPGADAVIPQEEVEVQDSKIIISGQPLKGDNIVPRGSDVTRNELLFSRSHRLRAQDVGLLTSLHIRKLSVYKQPIASVLSIGSELTNKIGMKDKVINSHNLVIQKLVESAGGISINLGVAEDDSNAIRPKLVRGLDQSDIVLTIGGSSVSEVDLVEETIDNLGSPGVVVHGLKLQPGRVAGFGVVGKKPIIMLPGLIQSTVNAFIFLAYPFIRLLQGLSMDRADSTLKARLSRKVEFHSFISFRKVVWVRLTSPNGEFKAEPIVGDSSSMSVIARSNGYIATSEGTKEIREEALVNVNMVPGISQGFLHAAYV